jgi:penicillin-binding protein 2
MAQFYATWLNGGTKYAAHLIKEVHDSEGNVISKVEPTIMSQVEIDPNIIEIVKEGMGKVTEEGGTAAAVFRNYPIKTGGKTGSAEFSSNSSSVGRAAYSWFASFAPYDNPEIAVVAVVYDGNKGYFTSKVVKAIYDEYFGLNKPAETPTPTMTTTP